MGLHYILDEKGNAAYVVLPIAEFNKLVLTQDEDLFFSDVNYEKGDDDNETVPNEIVDIMISQEVSLLAAWRIHINLNQHQVAEKLGLTQSAIAQMESKSSKPQTKTRERLAKIYECKPEQLTL